MENIQIIMDKDGIEHIIIDHGNDQFTSMPKSVYDEQLAQSKEITTPTGGTN